MISMFAHPKGPMWVHRNGVDVNLGGSGSERRAINNGLSFIQEEEPEKIDDDNVVHVVSGAGTGAKGKGEATSVGDIAARVPLPLNWPFCAPSNYPSPVEKMVKRTMSRANSMMLDSSVHVHGQKKACTVRTALAKRDNTFLTIAEDMLPTAAGSQDVLKVCLTQASLEQTK